MLRLLLAVAAAVVAPAANAAIITYKLAGNWPYVSWLPASSTAYTATLTYDSSIAPSFSTTEGHSSFATIRDAATLTYTTAFGSGTVGLTAYVQVADGIAHAEGLEDTILFAMGGFDEPAGDANVASASIYFRGRTADVLNDASRLPSTLWALPQLFSLNSYAVINGSGMAMSLQAPASVPAAGVPEPASWALMLGGFGVVGGMLRRRRVAPVRFG